VIDGLAVGIAVGINVGSAVGSSVGIFVGTLVPPTSVLGVGFKVSPKSK